MAETPGGVHETRILLRAAEDEITEDQAQELSHGVRAWFRGSGRILREPKTRKGPDSSVMLVFELAVDHLELVGAEGPE